MSLPMFEVDPKGLAKIAERRGKAFVLFELLQNAWDTDATEVNVTFEPIPGRPAVRLIVEDDHPEGFKNLAHAWTLFAESEKKGDAEKRGRFNLGEKLVLALCNWARIVTTTGGVEFNPEGRIGLRRKLEKGSHFEAEVKMTRAEYEEALEAAQLLIPPEHIRTTLNGVELQPRQLAGSELVTLPTEIADEEGYLRRRNRETRIKIYKPLPGETPTLFEMGIPVVETGDAYHVDIGQKVPLNMERDGVTASYLRTVRAAVLNTMAHELHKPEEAAAPWVRDAMASDIVEGQAVRQVMDTRFGRERVIFDPSDAEANNIAVSRGMTLIHGASLSKDEWSAVKRFEAAKPAGQVTPSPKPFHPDGDPLKLLPEEAWTSRLRSLVEYYQRTALRLLDEVVSIVVANDRGWDFNAAYSRADRRLTLNYARMRNYIEAGDRVEMDRLLIHELAHHRESNHLSENFHDECCRLGARMVELGRRGDDYTWVTKPGDMSEMR